MILSFLSVLLATFAAIGARWGETIGAGLTALILIIIAAAELISEAIKEHK
jgi:hypothetical protein